MSRNSNKRNSSNRGSTGSDIARSTLKVFLSNGDSRSVKCGEATDVKVGLSFLLFTQSCWGNIFFQFNVMILVFNRSENSPGIFGGVCKFNWSPVRDWRTVQYDLTGDFYSNLFFSMLTFFGMFSSKFLWYLLEI